MPNASGHCGVRVRFAHASISRKLSRSAGYVAVQRLAPSPITSSTRGLADSCTRSPGVGGYPAPRQRDGRRSPPGPVLPLPRAAGAIRPLRAARAVAGWVGQRAPRDQGPVMAKVTPGLWMLTNSQLPALGSKVAPAHSEPVKSPE
jgi:hypothetical protein